MKMIRKALKCSLLTLMILNRQWRRLSVKSLIMYAKSIIAKNDFSIPVIASCDDSKIVEVLKYYCIKRNSL